MKNELVDPDLLIITTWFHDLMTKWALSIVIATFFAVFMIVPAFAGGHLAITEAEVDDDEVEIETNADIPTDGSAGAFGFGAFTTDGKVVAVTTHGGVGPDSESQEDASDAVFHSHLVTLTDVTECDSELAVASVSFEEIADFEVDDNEVEIEDFDEELNGVVVSFVLTVEDGEICVNPVSIVDTTDDDDDDDDD